MLFLILSIITVTAVLLLLKRVGQSDTDTFSVVTINYLVCCIMGNIVSSSGPVVALPFWTYPWFSWALFLGGVFIAVFYLIALTAQKVGVSVAVITSKTSVVAPVLLSTFYFDEPIGLINVLGILLSLLAVVFISKRKQEHAGAIRSYWWLPVIVFIGSGVFDSSMKLIEVFFLEEHDLDHILTLIFGIAFLLGVILQLVKGRLPDAEQLWKTVKWGLALGLVNYYSVYFLLKALNQPELSGNLVFPINNIAIVGLSTLGAVVIFKEKLSSLNWIGLILAMMSILMITAAP